MWQKDKYRALSAVSLTLALASLVVVMVMSVGLSRDLRDEGKAFADMVRGAQTLVMASDDPAALAYATEVMSSNRYVPIILCDGGTIVSHRNLKPGGGEVSEEEAAEALRQMRASGDSLSVDLGAGGRQTIYYGESRMLRYVVHIRWLQIAAVALFLAVSYAVLTQARRRERDRLWKGLALETAHQLGTPITALRGWRDLLATGFADTGMVADELGKDIARLQSVSERFSHIGSMPALATTPLNDDLRAVADYMSHRTARGIVVSLDEPDGEVAAPHDPTLLRWAVENLCKNAADAIEGSGAIRITLRRADGGALIEVADTGKGIAPQARRRIFDTGYTTKARGWGIGLALVKRIVCEYHHGRIWVMESRPGAGTRFGILLKTEMGREEA